jgi:hypothetical protein
MLGALVFALGKTPVINKVRQVIFITDGEVGNESALFGYIKANLGKSRLFTVGIGSAPNSHFMRKAAEYGSGSFTYIGSTTEVQKKMDELFSKLESPVLSQIVIDWKGQRAEHWPKYIPDLYLGEPVVIAARLPKLGAEGNRFCHRYVRLDERHLDRAGQRSSCSRLSASRARGFIQSDPVQFDRVPYVRLQSTCHSEKYHSSHSLR